MTTASPTSVVENIGDTAGLVWKALSEQGPLSATRLVKSVGQPRDRVMQAIGWLAREGKLDFAEEGRTRVVSLC